MVKVHVSSHFFKEKLMIMSVLHFKEVINNFSNITALRKAIIHTVNTMFYNEIVGNLLFNQTIKQFCIL